MTINLYNTDCMTALRDMPDNMYDLAIVDPPYGIKRFAKRTRVDKTGKINKWDTKPSAEYFDELRRVSVHQIIWGANNFDLPSSEYFLIWNKEQPLDNFSSLEYAWVSPNLKKPAKMYTYGIHKLMGQKIHPTQKPVELYQWILSKYAKQGDRILDTHLGSGSIALACHTMGYSLDAYEIDAEYYAAAQARLHEHQRQMRLFV